MPSLKEIKSRIASVKSTQKITSAMKMVASAKLRKAQYNIDAFFPYQELLLNIVKQIMDLGESIQNSPLTKQHEIKQISIVAISSNSSLCGAFNSGAIKLLKETIEYYKGKDCKITVYPVGKKIEEAIKKSDPGINIAGTFTHLADKPEYSTASNLADILTSSFIQRHTDRIDIIYNHLKNAAVQIPTTEQFLPIAVQPERNSTVHPDYITEPGPETIINKLYPKYLRTKLYAILLDSSAAEHAARTMAMQIATDNADDILAELNTQFNKQRQQSITSELLDIVGGSEALK
ncbi:MAG: ATP synthase F1 subunit gamma [Dysgonamonadaceae bacterium]|jgi:F-type H+-transporting ATPase subunit gamma|nr:ATP synthase F1 subunit gamma [Dysgonamonadaceae bacterium]